jgi:hypothetical protein
VALKEIQPHYAHDSVCRDRFLLEAEVTGGLEHPGGVPVYTGLRLVEAAPRRLGAPADLAVVCCWAAAGGAVAARRRSGCAWTEKVCRKPLSAEAHLWTFAAEEGVPPHNNATERALRHGVIWRKTSCGTDGEPGSRFVERMPTVVATRRQRGRGVMEFLTACLRARLDGPPAPSLLS